MMVFIDNVNKNYILTKNNLMIMEQNRFCLVLQKDENRLSQHYTSTKIDSNPKWTKKKSIIIQKAVHALLRMSSLVRPQHNKKLQIHSHSWHTSNKVPFSHNTNTQIIE